ncbi:MAG: hypothetical protein DRG50_04805, partial [Deltaproteobacteria bacterium]
MLNDFEGREWVQRGPSVEDVAKNLKEFFKKTQKGKRGFSILLIILLLLWLGSGIYVVSPAEEGVVRR